MNKSTFGSSRFSLRLTIFTLLLLFPVLFMACSLEGDIEDLRYKPEGVPGPSIPAPEVLLVISGDGMITVSWTSVEEAKNYDVYLGTAQTPPATPVKTVSATTTVLDGLTNRIDYYVWIKAKNETLSSNFSDPGRGIPWPATAIPATPERPVIIPGTNQLTITWKQNGGAASYEVFINTSPSKPPAPEISTSKTSTVIENLANNVVYYLWIRAVNSIGKSDYSPIESGTPKIPTVAPSSPNKPLLTAGSHEINVLWQSVELATAYEVWFGTNANSGQAQKYGGDITGVKTETLITGLANETSYYVWIKAKNPIGASGFSSMASAKPSAFAVIPETPAAPTVIPGSGKLDIGWNTVEGALSYEIWTSLTSNSLTAGKYGSDISGSSVTLTSLTNGTTYYIWVRAKNNIGISELSPIASGTPTIFAIPPSVPQTAPTITAGSGQLTVSWQAVEGASAYEVWAGTTTNNNAATKLGNDVSALSTVITGLTNGVTYYVWIKAKNSAGTSGFSPMASGTPQAYALPPQAPAAPTVDLGSGQITVTWGAVQSAVSYEVWFGTTNDSGSSSKYGSDISISLSVIISGLNNGTTYYVWIKAKNSYGASAFSPAASGKPIANAAVPSLTAGNTQISVSWAAISGAEQYELFYGTGINPPQTANLTINAPATSTTINGSVNGTTYNVWIRGKNSTGIGALSGSATAKPIGNMGTVTLSAGNQQLSLNWPTVAGADQYEVYYGTSPTIPGSPSQTVSTTTATISGLTNGTTYNVWVKGKNVNGVSSTSVSVSGKPLATPGAPVLTPGFKELSVTWTAVAGADEYEVYYGIGSATTLATTTAGTTATITGLTGGTTYYVRLRAKNSKGFSDYGPSTSGATSKRDPGLYRGDIKIGNQNLNTALTWISTNCVNGDDFTIVLGANESIAPTTLGYSGKTVGITLQGYNNERTITLSSNGTMFTLNAGVTFTLDENVSLMGKTNNALHLLSIASSAILNINAGSKIYGNSSGVVINGTMNMYGGTICENSSSGVTNNGTFVMYGGTISKNTNGSGNSGVAGGNVGNFTMYGGTISGNYIGVQSQKTFIMHGGIISGNTYGGVVGNIKKMPQSESSQISGIIYGTDATGVDADGLPLKNGSLAVYFSSIQKRNTTAWETDQIDITTGKGLSANGNPPFGQ